MGRPAAGPPASRYPFGMRRLGLLLTLLLVTAATAAAADAPTLSVVPTRPFTVHGVRFRAAERVTVRITTPDGVRTHVVRATSRGSFTTTFTAVAIDRCTQWLVTARGTLGSRTTLRPRPFVFADCAPLD